LIVLAVFAALAALGTSRSQADLITFYFQGTVNNVNPVLSGEFSVGERFSGSYTFDSDTPNTSGGDPPNFGLYTGALTALSFTIDSYTGSATDGDINVWDNVPSDTYQVTSRVVTGPNVSDFELTLFQLEIGDSTNTALTSVALPLTPPNLEDFDRGFLRIGFQRPGEAFTPQVTVFNFNETGVLAAVPDRVVIDIKPGNDQNNVNICAQGVLPVAILSFESFDATEEVDPSTISLAGAGVKTVGKDDRPLTQNRDVNKDGITDLVVKILIEELGLESGDTEAELTGQTFDGKPIKGTDSVKVVQAMCRRTVED
jgi:hypothetical protein